MSGRLVESRHQSVLAITDAQTGIVTPTVMTTETVLLDPETGMKDFVVVNHLTRTVDGRTVRPDTANTCRACQKTISTDATLPCTGCRVTLCAGCAGIPAYCTCCRWKDRLARFWTWLTTL